MPWIARKKLAFIPLSRTNAQPPDVIPPDWAGQIMRRLFFDPQINPTTGQPIPGTDRSVRTYFHTVSSGVADLDVVVLPPQTIAGQDIPPDALEASMGAQLRAEGFDGAAIVMLGGPGGGSTSQLSNFAWSRFCMSDNLGNWVGEIFHQTNLCDLPDLFDFAGQYPTDENMGPFDQEAGYQATHLSAWTKRGVGWLEPSTVLQHPGGVAQYTLHAASLIQPPPTGRIAAVQIGAADVPYLMVEARLKADQFDINIPNEGVIVYRVQTTDRLGNAQNDTAPLALITKTALTVGQSITTDGATIEVAGAVLGGGFNIQVEAPPFDIGCIYAVDHNDNGRLLSYGDDGNPGNVSDPVVVGFDDWLPFKFLFSGRNLAGEDRIYAVDHNDNGRLLSYGDDGSPGNVSDPVVVGFDDWLPFKFLFGGRNLFGENRIYAVDQDGRLLSYRDDGTPGNVSDPMVVGFGGWLQFKFLFSGRNLAGQNCIYAVDHDGRLLSYGDDGTPGNVSDPAVVGFGGWLQFKFLFGGKNLSGEYRIYAVDHDGRLLSYGDTGTPGNVSDPMVAGFGGWLQFKFLFGGLR